MSDIANNKKTVYQELNGLFNFDGFGFNNNTQQSITNDKIVIKGNSPEEIYRKGLELEQKKELQNKFFRTTDRGFQKALQYEAARLPAYIDYEGMEYYPLISSALDLFMEEATTIGTNGKMLNVYSNKERIKSALEEFYYDRINININLPFWTRNLIKYGDNFVLLYGERKAGITHVKQMVNYEMERYERIKNGKPIVKFKERLTGDEFNSFEIAHFRLLGDDKYIPYGSSVLNKVRRVFRQLCLDSETDIWTPNGIVKIKNLNAGDNVYSYNYFNNTVIVTKVKNVIKTGKKERYEIKTRHRELTLTNDHPILIKNNNGEYSYKNINEINIKKDKLILPTIKDGLDSFKIKMDSKDYHVLLNDSGKSKIKNIEPNGIINKLKSLQCKTTIKNLHSFIKGNNRSILYDDYLKICDLFNLNLNDIDIYYFNSRNNAIVDKNLEFTIDNDFIKLFGFMLGDGWINKRNNSLGFALGVYENENEYYKNIFMKYGNYKYNKIEPIKYKGGQINFRSRELINIFEKLGFITGFLNKKIPDWVFSLSYDNKINFIKGIFDADGCDTNKLYCSSNYNLINSLRILAQTCNIQVGKILKSNRTETKINNKICNVKESYYLYLNIDNTLEHNCFEEKILSINKLDVDDVWDIEIDNDLHNFIANGIVVHNCLAEDAMLTYRLIRAGEKRVFKIDVGNIDEDDIDEYITKVATKFKRTSQISPNTGQIDYRFNMVGNDEDFFLPVRNANSVTGIDTLPGATNLSDIHDIEYLRDNLFIGLGVPKPFLSFQDAAGGGKNLAQFDIRFSKKVNRIQQAMIQELNKMGMIHLYLLGFDTEDINNFMLTLTNPSTQLELQKSELMRDKAQTYTELTRGENGIAAMSHTNAKRLIFNWSDKEIVDDLKQQKMEKVIMQEFADTPVTIKKTGLFADIDKRFAEPVEGNMIGGEQPQGNNIQQNQAGAPAPSLGGVTPEMGSAPTPPLGGGAPEMGGQPPIGGNNMQPISENNFNKIVNELVFGETKEENNVKIIMESENINNGLNDKAFNMVNEINTLLKTDLNESSENSEDINLDDITDLELS